MIYLSFVLGLYFHILLLVFLLLFGEGTVFILQHYSAIFKMSVCCVYCAWVALSVVRKC